MRGQLRRDAVPDAMPAVAPLYPVTEVSYRDVTLVSVIFETEVDACRSILPTSLEVPEPARAVASVIRVGRSSYGQYFEATINVRVMHRGELRRYNTLMFVSNDAALSAGREALAAPKKLGIINLEHRAEGVIGTVERPAGLCHMRLLVSPTRLVDSNTVDLNTMPSIGLRVVPPLGADPREIDLMETAATWRIVEQWEGAGAIELPIRNEIDPWGRLPIRRIVGGYVTRMDITQPPSTLRARI